MSTYSVRLLSQYTMRGREGGEPHEGQLAMKRGLDPVLSGVATQFCLLKSED